MTTFNKPILFAFSFIFAIWAGNAYVEYERDFNERKRVELAAVNLLNSFHIDMPNQFEYGVNEPIPFYSYLKSYNENKEDVSIAINSDTEDTSTLGEHGVDFALTYKDEYDREYERIIHFDFPVEDTQMPVVELKDEKFTVYLNDKVNNNKFVEEVFDYVEGNFEECEEESRTSCWILNGEINIKKEGKYEASIIAYDNHGNETESDKFSVTVKKRTVASGKSEYVDFDSRWAVVDGHQEEINAGYIARWGGDYWHHNWSSFMSQFWACGVGTTVKLDGRLWRCNGIQHLPCDGSSIIDNSGHDIIMDGSVQLVTCATNDGSWRYVMFLSPK